MPSALTYIVLAGTANFFGSQPAADIPPSVPSTTPSPVQEISQPQDTRNDYTSGVRHYTVHNEHKNWHEARRICQEQDGYLAIINSAVEAQTIGQLLEKSNLRAAHIGFHDMFENGEYVTVHGESLAKAGYEEWRTGEPNNWSGNEDCGAVWFDGLLNDVPCGHSQSFVCELSQDQVSIVQYQQAAKSTPTVELIPQLV